MQTEEKPYRDHVPQLGQVQFEGRRASCLTASSGEDMVVAMNNQ